MDTLTEDIKSLERAILSEARAEAEQTVAQANSKADDIRKHAKAKAEAESKEIMERARLEAERLRSQAVAASELKARTLLLEQREKLLTQVFENAGQKLPSVQKRADYDQIVLQLMREALLQLNASKAEIRADNSTQKLLKKELLEGLSKELKAELSVGKPLENGMGVIIESSNGHLHYDNTLETRLQRLQSGLRSPVHKILMGESK